MWTYLLDVETLTYGGASGGDVCILPRADELNHKVTEGSSLGRTGEDGETTGIGRGLVEVGVVASTTHHVHARVLPARETLKRMSKTSFRVSLSPQPQSFAQLSAICLIESS